MITELISRITSAEVQQAQARLAIPLVDALAARVFLSQCTMQKYFQIKPTAYDESKPDDWRQVAIATDLARIRRRLLRSAYCQ